MDSLRNLRPIASVALAAVGIGIASSVGCVAPKSALPAADAGAVARERLLQQEIAFSVGQKRQQRLADLAWPLQRDGAELCASNTVAAFGFSFESSDEYDDEERDAAIRALGLRRAPTVTIVPKGGPADYAAIQPGDVLTHVGRYRLPEGKRGVEHGYRRLREFSPGSAPFPAVPVRLEREGEPYIQELVPELLCDYPVMLWEDQTINAFADGEAVYITTGMMRFAEDDEELQVVIAHELAHNLAGHITAKKTNTLFGGLIGLAAGALIRATTGVNTGSIPTLAGMASGSRAFSQDFEREADYLGMYLLARAGVETEDTGVFWRRLAAENRDSIENSHRSTHPSTPERFVRLDATHEEIAAKRAAGSPLVPNRKNLN